MSIRAQIELALRQQTEEGTWNLSEEIIYEPVVAAIVTGIRACFRRGDASPETAMGVDYETFEGDITVYKEDLIVPPRAGDRVRTASELWTVVGIRAELPGAYILRGRRKVLRPAIED